MKISPKLLLTAILILSACTVVLAQPVTSKAPRGGVDRGEKVNLMQELSLSPDQLRQLREMNRDRKPRMEAAQTRMREANRALDMAVYSDLLDENDVAARLKEFQEAQAEVASIRFNSEVSLRKILTPDQLVRFRELRARVAENRRTIKDLRKENQQTRRPIQRMRRIQQQNPR